MKMFIKNSLFILLIFFNLTNCNILKKKFDSKDNVIIITNFKGDSLSNLIGQLKTNNSFKPITDSIEKTFSLKNSSTNKNFFQNSLINKSYNHKNSNKKIKFNENINKFFFKSTSNQQNFDDEVENKQPNSLNQLNSLQNYNKQNNQQNIYQTNDQQIYNQQNPNQQSYSQQNLNQQPYNQQNSNQQPYNQQPYHQQTYNQQFYNQQSYNQQPYSQQLYNQQSYSQQPYSQQSYEQQNLDNSNFNQNNQLNYNQLNNNQKNFDQASYYPQNYDQSNYYTQNYDQSNFNQLNYQNNLINQQNLSDPIKSFDMKMNPIKTERRNQENYYKTDFKNYFTKEIPTFYYPFNENKNLYDFFYPYVNKIGYSKDYINLNYLNQNLFKPTIPLKNLNKKFYHQYDSLKENNKTDDNQLLKNFELINNKILTHLLLNNYLKSLSLNITDPFIKKKKFLDSLNDDNQDRLAESNIIRKKVRRRIQPNQIIIKKYIQLPDKKIKRIQKKNSQKSIRPLIIKKIETPSIIIESPIKKYKQNFNKKINYYDDENFYDEDDNFSRKNFYPKKRKNFIDTNDGYQFEESEQKKTRNNFLDSYKLEKNLDYDYLAPDEKEEEFFESYKKNFLNQEKFSESPSVNKMFFLIKPTNNSTSLKNF